MKVYMFIAPLAALQPSIFQMSYKMSYIYTSQYSAYCMSKYHFNIFGGLVLFSAAKACFRALSSAWALRGPVGTLPLCMGLARSVVRLLAA